MAKTPSPHTMSPIGATLAPDAVELDATPGTKTEIVLPTNATGQTLQIQAGADIVSVYAASGATTPIASIAAGAIWTHPWYLRGGTSLWISGAGVSTVATLTLGLAP